MGGSPKEGMWKAKTGIEILAVLCDGERRIEEVWMVKVMAGEVRDLILQ